jgi:uncharacterized protein YbjT (DUF2867 family)
VRALVTGATGYVGSQLVPALVQEGHDVVALARNPASLRATGATVVRADLLDEDSTRSAVSEPFDVAYYLVHALGEGDYEELDRRAARTFARAARRAGVRRVVYLGGFVPEGAGLSQHLRSRDQVGRILTEEGADTVVLQAAAILGAGSTPFEIIRHLVDRLPVVPLPRFMDQRVQPIAIADVLHYLIRAADRELLPPGAYDIGGDRSTSYTGLVRTYADVAGRRRLFLPVPFVPAGGAASLIGPLTPVRGALVADLMASLANSMETADRRIRDLVPDPLGGLLDIREGMARAVADQRTLTHA